MHIRGETHDFPIVCKGFPSRNLDFFGLQMSHLHDFPTSYGFSHLFPWSAGTNSPRPMDPLRPGASKSTAWSLRWAPRRAARGSRCEASALETPRWPTRWVPWGPLGPWPGNPGDLDLNSAEEKNSVNLRMIRISMFFFDFDSSWRIIFRKRWWFEFPNGVS